MTAVLLFVTVFSVSVFANAATTFSPRLSGPAKTNKYYYSDINIFYKTGYGMPNCTAYAFGRAYELLKTEPKLCRYNAEEWYDYNVSNKYYSYGKTPKLGAIACWSYSGGGHVAVVEKIENGTVTFSNSEWGGRTFYTTTSDIDDKNFGGNIWWTFQGFIYIGNFSPAATEPKPTTPAFPTGIYRTNVDTTLNMRSGAGTSYDWIASIPDGVKLTVTQTKQNGGYTWGYTTYKGKKGWVALDYCVYVSPIPTQAPATTKPTVQSTTAQPTTAKPTAQSTTAQPTTAKPTTQPTTAQPTTAQPTTQPTTVQPTTVTHGLGVGDVNCDGSIDVMDATEIQKYIIELVSFTDEQREYADFDFSGDINIVDATSIQLYIVRGW